MPQRPLDGTKPYNTGFGRFLQAGYDHLLDRGENPARAERILRRNLAALRRQYNAMLDREGNSWKVWWMTHAPRWLG